MKKRILLFLVFGILCCGVLQAQTPEVNKEKYVQYRERLRNELMFYSGDGSVRASHLPMERKYHNGKCMVARWADAVWWQGHYVGVLATEYELKRRAGESTENTLKELACALDVYDRLDREGESCWNGDPMLNGFYIRDDIQKEDTSLFCVGAIAADYIYYCGKTGATRHAPSQDQAWGSYIVFALVKKFVPDSAIQRHVSDICERMVRGMQYTDRKGNKSWQIVNPVTDAVMQKEGDIQWLQYAHGTIATQLTGKNMHFGNSNKAHWKNIWNILQDNVLIDGDGHFTWYGVISMSAVMNEGGTGSSSCYDWLVKTTDKIVRRHPEMKQELFFPHLPLLNIALYGSNGKQLVDRKRYEAYLNTAPANGAITERRNGVEVRTEAPWHTLSLFCPWHNSDTGTGNMIDYMLLYNLFHIVYD